MKTFEKEHDVRYGPNRKVTFNKAEIERCLAGMCREIWVPCARGFSTQVLILVGVYFGWSFLEVGLRTAITS